jgi:hypothetical protein
MTIAQVARDLEHARDLYKTLVPKGAMAVDNNWELNRLNRGRVAPGGSA